MEELINGLYEIIKDYRADEENDDVVITKRRIRRWIRQFEEEDREFILTELIHIFKTRYVSKEDARNFSNSIVKTLADDLNYDKVTDFLDHAVFLDLQEDGKSQKSFLEQINQMLQNEFGYDLEDCGNKGRKHFIYVDDLLCTGSTLVHDIQEWCKENYDDERTNLEVNQSEEIDLIFVYIFIHRKNFLKKRAEMRRTIGKGKEYIKHKMYFHEEIDNDTIEGSKIAFVIPFEDDEEENIIEYKETITTLVNDYTDGNGWNRKIEEFYRPEGHPVEETLFTSNENRNRFENIILNKGIDIISNTHNHNNNFRALGYSLPSQKNFGFGTLCFTWRNVANNTPLVFWYVGGGFYPLFVKR